MLIIFRLGFLPYSALGSELERAAVGDIFHYKHMYSEKCLQAQNSTATYSLPIVENTTGNFCTVSHSLSPFFNLKNQLSVKYKCHSPILYAYTELLT